MIRDTLRRLRRRFGRDQEREAENMARAYVAEHPRLAEVLAHADRVSGSTGVQLADSVFLHKAVLRLRPTTDRKSVV